MQRATPQETVESTPQAYSVIDIDLPVWKVGASKMTLRETGELVRALVRARNARRPNREQRLLLAIFTRPHDAEAPHD